MLSEPGPGFGIGIGWSYLTRHYHHQGYAAGQWQLGRRLYNSAWSWRGRLAHGLALLTTLLAVLPPTPLALAHSDCKNKYRSPGNISVSTLDFERRGYNGCEFTIETPENNLVLGTHGYHLDRNTDRILYNKTTGSLCLEIMEVAQEGEDEIMKTWCFTDSTPSRQKVFHTNILRVTLNWPPQLSARFWLTFDSLERTVPCKAACMDENCQPKVSLVCNGVVDCPDGSDEAETHCQISKPAKSKQSTTTVIKVIVIVIVVVFIVACGIVCAVHYYRDRGIVWRAERRGSGGEHNQLHRHTLQPQATEVVYVPGAGAQDQYRREMALREQQYNAHTDHANINLPPSIPISVDGEEGYPASQQRLLLAERISETESVRAPPNRTIYDGESPPPYQRSQSVGLLDRHSGKRNNSGSPSGVPRCYSMSSSNRQYSNLGPGYHHNGTGVPPSVVAAHYGPTRVPEVYGSSGTRTSLPPPRGHSRSGSSTSSSCGSAPGNLGPPPSYSDIITSLDIFNKHPDSNV